MTVGLMLLCEHDAAAVVLADREFELNARSWEHFRSKITCFGGSIVACGSGTDDSRVFTCSAVNRLLESSLRDYGDVAGVICDAYVAHRTQQVVDAVLLPQGFRTLEEFRASEPPDELEEAYVEAMKYKDTGEAVLFAVATAGGVRIGEVCDPGTHVDHTFTGFSVVGVSCLHVQAFLTSIGFDSVLSVPEALSLGVLAKKVAEQGPGVGRETDAVVLTAAGAVEVPQEWVKKMEAAFEVYGEEQTALRREFLSAGVEAWNETEVREVIGDECE